MSNINDIEATQDHVPPTEFSQQDFIGKIFGGKYKVLKAITKGGMGCVFKAEQVSLRRNVALKVVLASEDVQANQRFLLEASLTANLDHPNIVKVFDFGRTEDGILFLVMELLSGQDLKSWVANKGPLSVRETVQMAKQLCGALSEAHSQNVIHRDIKPTNIMLSKKAGAGLTTKLIDFGLVKNVGQSSGHSRTGIVLGTPMYMSPEQITATGVDDRADIYAIGLTMYFALTGKRPYPKRGLSSLIHAHLSEELPNLQDSNSSIPATHMINWIIKSAVAKNVQNRFQNTLQMLEALEICERFMDRDSFPTIELNKGLLTSLSDGVIIDPELPQSPLVQSGAYVEDGSAISDDFAQTIGLKVDDHLPTVGFESSSTLGPHTLAHQQPSVVPASMEPTETRAVNESETNSTSPLMKGIGAFFVLAIVVGYGVFSNPSTKSTDSIPASVQSTPTAVEHEVSLDSVPSGADIFIDGQFGGSTPTVVKAKSGKSKEIRISLEGYEEREFVLSENTQDEMVVQLKKIVVTPEQTAPKKPTLKAKPVKKSIPKTKAKAKETVKKVQEPKKAKPKKKGELKETEWD